MKRKGSKEVIIEAYRQAFYKANGRWPVILENGSWLSIGVSFPAKRRWTELPAMTERLLRKAELEGKI